MAIPQTYFDWMVPDRLAACVNPTAAPAVQDTLRNAHIDVAVNLHERSVSEAVARLGIEEIHLPVMDMTPPTQAQLTAGVQAISAALAADKRVAVHCGAGLGRSGTLLAAYFVSQGMTAPQAIAHVRSLRPGSVETSEQEAAVAAYAAASGR